MVKVTALRYAAIGMATLGLAGVAAASTVSVSDTGSHSTQRTNLTSRNTATMTNNNHVGVGNLNQQHAKTGNVSARDNTTVSGDVGSGHAMNHNTASTSVSVDNSGSGAGLGGFFMPADDSVSYDTTGSHSNQTTTINNTNTLRQTNNNNVGILNLNSQSATSGRVDARDNTTVGGVTSGDASNTSSTDTSVTISN